MRVERLLKDGAERFGAKVAFVSGRQHHTYRELAAKSARLGAALTANGVARGDRVVLFMDNTFEAIVSTFAVLSAGAVACPVDPAIGAEELADILGALGAVGIATEARLATVTASAVARSARVKVVVLSGGDRASTASGCLNFEEVVGGAMLPNVAPCAADETDDPAVVLGADGEASDGGEILTHADLVAAAAQSETPADAVVVATLPLTSHYGLYQLLTALKAGATQVLQGAVAVRDGAFGPVDRLQAEARIALAG